MSCRLPVVSIRFGRLFCCLCQFLIDEHLQGLGAAVINASAIDEHGRSAADFRLTGIHNILYQTLFGCLTVHVPVKGVHIQADLFCCLKYFWHGDGIHGKQGIMHLPELALVEGSQTGQCSRFRHIVNVGKRHVFKGDLYGMRVFFEHLLEQWLNRATVGSLKV